MNAQYQPPFITRALRIAALVGFLGVALGAFGAHGLKAQLEAAPNGLEHWKTAVLYHLIHAAVLYTVAGREQRTAFWFLLVGVILFSGSLYALALTQIKGFAHVAPFGGTALLIGWLLLALHPVGTGRKS